MNRLPHHTPGHTIAVGDPVAAAVEYLIAHSTLAPYVTLGRREGLFGGVVTEITLSPDEVPYEMWGTATQLLWEFLCSLAGRSVQVNLYEMLSRLDNRNTAAVFEALRILGDGIQRPGILS